MRPYPFPNFPRDYDEAVSDMAASSWKNGLLPWRTAEIHLKLVEAFRQQTGYSRDNIKFFSSVLTHYVSDAHVPFHAVVNYDGQLHRTTWDPRAVRVRGLRPLPADLRVTPKAVAPVANARDFIFDALIASSAGADRPRCGQGGG